MLKILKPTLLVIYFCIASLCQIFAEDKVSENETTVEIRQQTMQAIWQRLDRLSALIARPGDVIASSDGNSIVIGNRETQSTETYALIHGREAIQDASEIVNFLKQVKDLILISTINLYGNNCETPSKETDIVQPSTLYSLVKSIKEKIYEYYSQNLNLNVTILRLSHIYGADKKIGIINNLISSLESSKSLKISHNGNQARDFLYIDDAIQGIINAIEHPNQGFTIYNISSEEKISTNNLIEILEKNHTSKISYEKQNNFPDEKCIWESNQKAKKQINFSPKIKIEEGLQKILLTKKTNNFS